MQQLDDSIARYMTELDRAHREPALVTDARVEHIKEKMQTVKQQMRQLKKIGKQMSQTPDGQISLTDPDARSMATSGRGWHGWLQRPNGSRHETSYAPRPLPMSSHLCGARTAYAERGPHILAEAHFFAGRAEGSYRGLIVAKRPENKSRRSAR
jgi:hypothetical protein